jgi:chondroitin AC lyase
LHESVPLQASKPNKTDTLRQIMLILAAVVCLAIGNIQKAYSSPQDVAQLTQNLINMNLINPPTSYDRLIGVYISNLKPDGSWVDINYTDTNPATWPSNNHVGRLQKMAGAYITNGSKFNHNETLLNASLLALRWWYTAFPICPTNWFYTLIGVNMAWGPTCLIFRNQGVLTDADIAGCDRYLYKTNLTYSAVAADFTNFAWASGNIFYRGAFNNNETEINDTVWKLAPQIALLPGFSSFGPKVDGAFFYHGLMDYIGGYGQVFYSSMMQFTAYWFVNTSFQEAFLQNGRGDLLGRLVVQSQLHVNFPSNTFELTACGRGIGMHCCGNPLGDYANGMANVVSDPQLAQQLRDYHNRSVTRRNDPPIYIQNWHFWISDYVAHRRPNWNTFVRMVSKRTNMYETCMNGQNLLGMHFTDGVTLTYFDGTDYFLNLAAMNFNMLPGTTLESNAPLVCNNNAQKGYSNFVGGVSQGTVGVSAFDFGAAYNGTVRAKKSYFFFENCFVALGANVTWNAAANNGPVITTIEQRPMVSNFSWSVDNLLHSTLNQSQQIGSISWFHQGSIGYIIPGNIAQKVNFYCGNQTGSWNAFSHAFSSGYATARFLTVGIEHTMQGSGYEYIVVPNVTLSDFKAQVNNLTQDIAIVQRDNLASAVVQKSTGVAELIFWKAGYVVVPQLSTTKGQFNISVSAPCALVIQFISSSSVQVSASDPTQLLKSVVISLASADGQFIGKLSLSFPQADYAGSGLTKSLILSQVGTFVNSQPPHVEAE